MPPPGPIPAALHMLCVSGKQYQSMFTPHVLSLFTYQHPGQLLRTLLKGGGRGLITWPFLIKLQSLLSWFIFLLLVGGGSSDGSLFVCLLAGFLYWVLWMTIWS